MSSLAPPNPPVSVKPKKKHTSDWIFFIIIIILVVIMIIMYNNNSNISVPIVMSDTSINKPYKYYIVSDDGMYFPKYLNTNSSNSCSLGLLPITKWIFLPNTKGDTNITDTTGILVISDGMTASIGDGSTAKPPTSTPTLVTTSISVFIVTPKDNTDTNAAAGYTGKSYTFTTGNNILYVDNGTPKIGDSNSISSTVNKYWKIVPTMFF